jgi:gamma-glutamyltranspeptidase
MQPMAERRLSASGKRFAIATPHRAATQAGVAAFDAGGNAVDAALAAAVTLAVVYPHMCGVGGDLFALVQALNGQTIALNASGAAPRAIDVEAIRETHDAMPEHGPIPITVPGAVSGWAALADLGADLPFDRAFDAAIARARDGVPIARSLASSLRWEPERLFADPGMRQVFTRDGRPLAEGELLVQPALAGTLEAIAHEGPSAFYRGDVGARLVAGLRRMGSPMTLEDLASHRPELDSPIAARYRDLHVSVAPPNSQGFALLEMLLAVERLGIDPDPLGADAAILAEVFAAASADRDRHNADPRFARVPVGTLLDEGHIAALCDQVRAGSPVEARPAAGDTIALVAADGDGRAVSLIQSLWSGFGSGILEPSTGIVCHDRGAAFSLDPESPNVLAGGKRPAHTLMPVLVHRDGRLVAATGSMGGGGQPQINFQNLVRSFDLGMDPEAAVSAPRWLMGGMDLHPGRSVELEAGVPPWVHEALEHSGFAPTVLDEVDEDVGHAHLIRVGEDGTLLAATDPRADGEARAG